MARSSLNDLDKETKNSEFQNFTHKEKKKKQEKEEPPDQLNPKRNQRKTKQLTYIRTSMYKDRLIDITIVKQTNRNKQERELAQRAHARAQEKKKKKKKKKNKDQKTIRHNEVVHTPLSLVKVL